MENVILELAEEMHWQLSREEFYERLLNASGHAPIPESVIDEALAAAYGSNLPAAQFEAIVKVCVIATEEWYGSERLSRTHFEAGHYLLDREDRDSLFLAALHFREFRRVHQRLGSNMSRAMLYEAQAHCRLGEAGHNPKLHLRETLRIARLIRKAFGEQAVIAAEAWMIEGAAYATLGSEAKHYRKRLKRAAKCLAHAKALAPASDVSLRGMILDKEGHICTQLVEWNVAPIRNLIRAGKCFAEMRRLYGEDSPQSEPFLTNEAATCHELMRLGVRVRFYGSRAFRLFREAGRRLLIRLPKTQREVGRNYGNLGVLTVDHSHWKRHPLAELQRAVRIHRKARRFLGDHRLDVASSYLNEAVAHGEIAALGINVRHEMKCFASCCSRALQLGGSDTFLALKIFELCLELLSQGGRITLAEASIEGISSARDNYSDTILALQKQIPATDPRRPLIDLRVLRIHVRLLLTLVFFVPPSKKTGAMSPERLVADIRALLRAINEWDQEAPGAHLVINDVWKAIGDCYWMLAALSDSKTYYLSKAAEFFESALDNVREVNSFLELNGQLAACRAALGRYQQVMQRVPALLQVQEILLDLPLSLQERDRLSDRVEELNGALVEASRAQAGSLNAWDLVLQTKGKILHHAFQGRERLQKALLDEGKPVERKEDRTTKKRLLNLWHRLKSSGTGEGEGHSSESVEARFRTLLEKCRDLDASVLPGVADDQRFWFLSPRPRVCSRSVLESLVALSSRAENRGTTLLVDFFFSSESTLLAFLIPVAGEATPEIVEIPFSRAERMEIVWDIAVHWQDTERVTKSKGGGIHDLMASLNHRFAALLKRIASMSPAQLLISPHAELFRVPLHALEWNGEPMNERSNVAYLPCAALTDELTTEDSQQARSNVTAAVFVNPTGVGRDLPGSRAEGETVSRVLTRGDVQSHMVAESQCSRKEFSRAIGDSTIVHVACHGQVDERGKVQLVLSDGSFGANDVLTQLSGSGSRLVFVNACWMGTGDLGLGVRDEFVSFVRALMIKGTRAIIANVWPVSDDVALLFATRFYQCLAVEHLSVGDSYAQALRTCRREFPAGYEWSPFMLYGDWTWRLGD